MRNHLLCVLLISGFALLPGCAHVISKNLRAEVDPTLSFSRVLQNPDAFKGKTVVWGGEIVETTNQKDGGTLLEVLERRLDRQGEPEETSPSQGRFLVLSQEYMDPYVYRRGKKITVAGEILGQKIKPLGEMDYRYPLLSVKQMHLWPVYYYAPVPYYPYYPYYYDPWWRPYYWYPWGYYPYRWGFGFHY